MVRSAVTQPGGPAQGHDAPSQSAAAALAKLSASLKPQPVIRLPAIISVRVLVVVLVVVLSVGLLLPLMSHARNGFNGQVATVHSVPRMPRTIGSKINWKSYTLSDAAKVSIASSEWPLHIPHPSCCMTARFLSPRSIGNSIKFESLVVMAIVEKFAGDNLMV